MSQIWSAALLRQIVGQLGVQDDYLSTIRDGGRGRRSGLWRLVVG